MKKYQGFACLLSGLLLLQCTSCTMFAVSSVETNPVGGVDSSHSDERLDVNTEAEGTVAEDPTFPVSEPVEYKGYTVYRRWDSVSEEKWEEAKDFVDESLIKTDIPQTVWQYDIVNPYLSEEYLKEHTVGIYYISNRLKGGVITSLANDASEYNGSMLALHKNEGENGLPFMVVDREDGYYTLCVLDKDGDWLPICSKTFITVDAEDGVLKRRTLESGVSYIENNTCFKFEKAESGAYTITGKGIPEQNGYTLNTANADNTLVGGAPVQYFGMPYTADDGGNEWFFIPVGDSPEFNP